MAGSAFVVLALLALCRLVSSSGGVAAPYAGLQFIFYNGTISGSLVHLQEQQANCGDNGIYYFADLANVSLRIGATPGWDRNPFYFELSRVGTQGDPLGDDDSYWTDQEPNYDHCSNGWGGYYHEVIHNMGFATTRYACRDGYPCEAEVRSSWTFTGSPYVNVSKATVEQVTDEPLSEDDPGPYYSVTGDESTWIDNNNDCDNMFDFSMPTNYTEEYGCVEDMLFFWRNWTVFSYTLNFTNTTSKALFTIDDPARGNISLSFSGQRVDGDDPELAPSNAPGEFSTISLADPASHEMPRFTFADGSSFLWEQGEMGRWTARPGPHEETVGSDEQDGEESAAQKWRIAWTTILAAVFTQVILVFTRAWLGI